METGRKYEQLCTSTSRRNGHSDETYLHQRKLPMQTDGVKTDLHHGEWKRGLRQTDRPQSKQEDYYRGGKHNPIVQV